MIEYFSVCVLFAVSAADIDLTNECIRDNGLAKCSYIQPGMYYSSQLDRTVERLEFPRLTGATVDLRNLPEVTVVEVESQLFDKRLPCDLITGNLKTVTVAIVQGGGQPIQCVSVNDLGLKFARTLLK